MRERRDGRIDRGEGRGFWEKEDMRLGKGGGNALRSEGGAEEGIGVWIVEDVEGSESSAFWRPRRGEVVPLTWY